MLPSQRSNIRVHWNYSLVRHRAKEILRRKHWQGWISRDDCRQTKMFVTDQSSNRSKFLLSLCKRDLTLITGIMTGHCQLNSHLSTIRVARSSTCVSCLEGEETAEHFMCSCPAFSGIRYRIFGVHLLDNSSLKELPLEKVLSFIKKTGRFSRE